MHLIQFLQIFKYLSSVPFSVIQAPRNDILLSAACYFIANSISPAEIQLEKNSSVPYWRQIVDTGLKQRNVTVQEAAARALQAVSKLVDCSAIVER
jgi:PIN domain nuclease of toxin-antitoxin system